jgi:HK97 gp10 family phage protein
MITMKIEGLEDVKRMLAALPDKLEAKVVRKAVFAGAALLRQGQRQAAPIRTTGGPMKTKSGTRSPGFLKKNIKMRFKKRQGRAVKIYQVGPLGEAFYGRFVELGHAAGKRKKYGRGVTVETGLRMVPAHPFLVPAFNNLTQQMIDTMKGKLIEGALKEGTDLGFKVGNRTA